MRITRLVAGPTANPQAWMDWLSIVALTLGLPDPLPAQSVQLGPDGQPMPVDQNLITRRTVIGLEAFPALLRPPGVDPVRRSAGLTMNIRRAIYSHQTGVDGEGRPTFATDDRGWECDIAIYKGPGRWWDVELLPDIITMAVMTNGQLNWQTQTQGEILLPMTPDGWARVDPVHPTLDYAQWQSSVVEAGPMPLPPP